MITLERAKQHLKVLHVYEDELINSLINAALTQFESWSGRKLYASQAALNTDTAAPEHSIVINDTIICGCLLMIGHLYVYRAEDAIVPRQIEHIWQPYQVIKIA